MNKLGLLFGALLMAGSGLGTWMPSVSAQDLSNMYDRRTLERDRQRYAERIEELVYERAWGFFDNREKTIVPTIDIQTPAVGQGRSPLDFYASSQNSVVYMPAISLKFVEDLSTAYAWLYVNNCRLKPVDEYMAMLRYGEASNFPGNRYPSPLEALGIPDTALQDRNVDDLSLRFRNEAWAFIVLHELAHVIYQHPGNRAVTPAQSQRNESQADRFALDILQRSETIPMGMVLWFQATAPWFPNRANYSSNAEFEAAVQTALTHPISPQRLRAISQHMQGWSANSSSSTQFAEVTSFIAPRLNRIAETMADPDIQLAVAAIAIDADLEDLAPQCQ